MKQSDASDETLHRVTGSIFIGYAILVAHKLGLFRLLSKGNLSLEMISDQLNIKKRAAQALLSAACSYELLDYVNHEYGLSYIGKQYLSEESPSYFGSVFDLYIHGIDQVSFHQIEASVLTNCPQVYSSDHLFDIHKEQDSGRRFTNSMHCKSYSSAYSWPKHLPMDSSDLLVDIGGGSGVHTIAACHFYPIKAIICDLPEILPFTSEKVLAAGFEKRISLFPIDMWKAPYPKGNIHFYSDIFHDWNEENCLFLAKKSFESLPEKGRIILNEVLFDEGKAGPELAAAYNVKMLYWTEGQQYSKHEIINILMQAGFENIKVQKYFGHWSLVVGEKK